VSKQTLTVEIEVPKGYELTGVVRPPQQGEYYLDGDWKSVSKAHINFSHAAYPILRKAENWKPLHSGQACYFGERQDRIKIRVWSQDRTVCSDNIVGTVKDLTFWDGIAGNSNQPSIRFRRVDGYTFVVDLNYAEYLEEEK